MKVITLWQPWASFIALGWKTIETRTHDRFKNLVGETIGIHAGKEWDNSYELYAGDYLTTNQLNKTFGLQIDFEDKGFRRGEIICTATVFDASWLSPYNSKSSLVPIFNDHEFFGLFLCEIQIIKPIPVKGKQGIWNYEFKEGELIYL